MYAAPYYFLPRDRGHTRIRLLPLFRKLVHMREQCVPGSTSPPGNMSLGTRLGHALQVRSNSIDYSY